MNLKSINKNIKSYFHIIIVYKNWLMYSSSRKLIQQNRQQVLLAQKDSILQEYQRKTKNN